MTWRFHHGWGFDRDMWGPLMAALGVTGETEDRGYYGPARLPDPLCRGAIGVGHSLGGVRMLAEAAPEMRAMIVINGFDRFSAAPDHPGVPGRVLGAMIRRCAADPAATARDFRARCGEDRPLPGAPTPRLSEDLCLLRDADRRGQPAAVPLLVLHGARDPILGDAHRAAGFTFRPHDAATHPEAGHLLPLSHPDWCAARIADFLAGIA